MWLWDDGYIGIQEEIGYFCGKRKEFLTNVPLLDTAIIHADAALEYALRE